MIHPDSTLPAAHGIEIRPIARIRTDFPTKFGIPRQAGLAAGLQGTVVFEPDYRQDEALRGLGSFSHIWLIWGFSENEGRPWSPTVRPPRLGGNVRMGVFATRSPFRPNGLGLSCVRLRSLQKTEDFGTVLLVEGADMTDGTPIYDIKPYLPYADCHPEATGGFTDRTAKRTVKVEIPDGVSGRMNTEDLEALKAVLREDPRPAYQDDPERTYAFEFGGKHVEFRVEQGILTVTEIR